MTPPPFGASLALGKWSRQNGETLEIDVYDNGSRNEAYLVEVKSHLAPDGIAAVDIPDNMKAKVMKQGLYLARIHDGEFELLTPRGFKPAPFKPDATQQNGKIKKGHTTTKNHAREK